MKHIMDLTIQNKLIIMLSLMILSILMMMGLKFNSDKNINNLNQTLLTLSEIKSGMLMLRRNEKDFLARLDPRYIDKFNKNHGLLLDKVATLKNNIELSTVDQDIANELKNEFNDYGKAFTELVTVQRKQGLNPKDGLYGGLRKAVHDVEGKVKSIKDDTLMKDMLMLRRREKDFMLRWDIKYLEKFNKDIQVFRSNLKASSHAPSIKSEISTYMDSYEKQFREFVSLSQKKGLNSKEGLLGHMRNTVHKSEDVLNKANETIKPIIHRETLQSNVVYVALALISALVLITLSILIVKSIVGPVRKLHELMLQAKKEQNFTLRTNSRAKDEIGEMSRALDEMLNDFSQAINKVQIVSSEVGNASMQLTNVVHDTNSALSVHQSHTEQAATAMTEISMTVKEVSDSINQAAVTSSHVHQETLNGKAIVEEAVRSIQQLGNDMDATSIMVSKLEDDSLTVSTVLDVIKGIAEQTNLLALNAAIEAARAGEQGRGFAVVADEVRTLASRTQDSTEEIARIIEQLQSNSKKAVHSISENAKKALDSVKQALKANSALDSIATSVNAINTESAHIANASDQQAIATEEINRNITNISMMAEQTSAGSIQTKAASDALTSHATELEEMVSHFKVS